MKTKDSISAFFWHWLSREALYNGWDMEEDIYPSLESIKGDVALTLKDSELEVTFGDLIEVAKGDLSGANFKAWMEALYPLVKDEDPIAAVMVSMHSGSSDYFTVEMIKDFVENESNT